MFETARFSAPLVMGPCDMDGVQGTDWVFWGVVFEDNIASGVFVRTRRRLARGELLEIKYNSSYY